MSSGETIQPSTEFSRRNALRLGGALGLGLFLEACSGEPPLPNPEFAPTPDWQLDYSQQPEGALDSATWNIRTGDNWGRGSNQLQTYTSSPQNVRSQHDLLILQGNYLGADHNPEYTAGRIDTLGKKSFGYGKLVITAQIPKGVGTWPAMWLLADAPRYDPAAFGLPSTPDNKRRLNGEIDIMEAVGVHPGAVYPNAHTLDTQSVNGGKYGGQLQLPGDGSGFHRYGLEHSPDTLIFTFDDTPYHRINKQDIVPKGHEKDTARYWPFDQSYYLILNLALGGDWAGQDKQGFPPDGIDTTSGPWQLQVRSLQHYPMTKV